MKKRIYLVTITSCTHDGYGGVWDETKENVAFEKKEGAIAYVKKKAKKLKKKKYHIDQGWKKRFKKYRYVGFKKKSKNYGIETAEIRIEKCDLFKRGEKK